MAVYLITSEDTGAIDYGATKTAAILQSARFLLGTMLDTCPLHREFGFNPPIDDPSEYARAALSAQIIEKLERNIPEIEVREVKIEQSSLEGRLLSVVKVEIADGTV